MADIELNEDPTSTWGATEEYKAVWHEKYGKSAPKSNASKADWVQWATDPVHGTGALSTTDAEAMTRDELESRFGGAAPGGIYSAPTAPAGTTPAGSGEGPEGNQANDPAKQTATGGRAARG